MSFRPGQEAYFEVKDRSPFLPDWHSKRTRDELLQIGIAAVLGYKQAKLGNAKLTIHGEESWGGSLEYVEEVMQMIELEGLAIDVLVKGIFQRDDAVQRVVSLGAKPLVVGRIPSGVDPEDIVPEPLTLTGLAYLDEFDTVVHNDRNPISGHDKGIDFLQARKIRGKRRLIQASNILTLDDIHDEADGFIVGRCMTEVATELEVVML